MQRTPGTPLNDPTSSAQVEDAATPEPADASSAGSLSSHPTPETAPNPGDAAPTDESSPAGAVGTEVPEAEASSSAGPSGGDAEGADGGRADRGGSGSDGDSPSGADAAAKGGEVVGKRSWRWTLVFGGVGLVVLFLDQLTKSLALAHLTPGEPVNVIGSLLKFNLIRNSGAAFSLGSGYTPYISVIQIAVALGVIYLSRRLGSAGWAIAFGLLFGGAVGNILDRIFREPSPFHGHVVDFLQTPHWAIFNVADMAVTSAAVLLVLQTLRGVKLDGTREHRR
jgi:signal peptidase II